MTIQRGMVGLILLAILLWGGREMGPDLVRRRRNCRAQADYHSQEASIYTRQMPSWSAESKAYRMRMAAEHRRMERKYRRALCVPWEFYVLGSEESDTIDRARQNDAMSIKISPP